MEYLAAWGTEGNWNQTHEDGREQINDVVLPPLRTLEKHALAIVRGGMT